ncbi:MAG: formimidoylglutamase [Bacteroidota bacterium]|nr:formimidoylglutamase [Bacteroidota bacterium]
MIYDLIEYLTPLNLAVISGDASYNDSQIGSVIKIYEEEIPDFENIDIIIVGINEFRGSGIDVTINSADAVRRKFYELHYWHKEISIADIGNIKCGSSLNDSYSAITIVLKELLQLNKTVVIIGGSHDNTLAQYFAYKELNKIIDATVVDATIDLRSESTLRSENFLMEMLTGEPNMVRHYNHIAFQSYFVHPRMLETMDKLRFDCFRVGNVREELSEMEPVIRNSDMFSFDIAAIKSSDAPASACSPNGLTGEEACTLIRYAGMSPSVSSAGIYGFDASKDSGDLTALQIAQMLWYFIDGKNRSLQESALNERQNFNEYHTAFAEVDTVFIQSKKTGRWWMQMPDKKMIACSYKDYLFASRNEIPERWLRAQERDV